MGNNNSKTNDSSFDSYLIKKQGKKDHNVSNTGKAEPEKPPLMEAGDFDAMKNRVEKNAILGNISPVPGQVHLVPGNYSKNYSVSSHKTRKLNAAIEVEDLINVDVQDQGFLPWEKQNVFSEIRKVL